MKAWTTNAALLASVLATHAEATTRIYEFDFTVAFAGSTAIVATSTGTGRLAFNEAVLSEATAHRGSPGNFPTATYGSTAGYLEYTYDGVTKRLIEFPQKGATSDTGFLLQDHPDFNGGTYDLFAVYGSGLFQAFAIFGTPFTLSDIDLTGANLEKLWTDRRSAVFRPDNGVTANVTALRAVSAVPEPASWVLMLNGMALTGYALRRRRTLLSMA